MKRIIPIMLLTLFLSGCSNMYIDDGVPRNENGTPLLGHYNSAVENIDYRDQAILNGQAYISGIDFNLSAGQSYYIAGVTDGRMVAMDFRQIQVIDLANQNTEVGIQLYEGGTLTSNGTIVPIRNRQRNIPDGNNTFKIYENITYNNIGTNLEPFDNYIISDRKSERVMLQDIGYIMKSNTTYILKITNYGTGADRIRIKWSWHEDLKQ